MQTATTQGSSPQIGTRSGVDVEDMFESQNHAEQSDGDSEYEETSEDLTERRYNEHETPVNNEIESDNDGMRRSRELQTLCRARAVPQDNADDGQNVLR